MQKDDEHEVLSDAIDAPKNIKHHKKRVPTLIPGGGGGLLNRSAGYAPGLFVLTHQGKVSI